MGQFVSERCREQFKKLFGASHSSHAYRPQHLQVFVFRFVSKHQTHPYPIGLAEFAADVLILRGQDVRHGMTYCAIGFGSPYPIAGVRYRGGIDTIRRSCFIDVIEISKSM